VLKVALTLIKKITSKIATLLIRENRFGTIEDAITN